MAGLLQVLYGSKDSGFHKAIAVNGSDDEPLILPADGEEAVTDKICTRPFACDLDGDGNLDLVVGNFTGTFGFFKGLGEGKFEPTSKWLEAGGVAMRVDTHSDPFLIDWDKDGDLDLLSGSAQGGAFLFVNSGSKTEPKFDQRVTLLESTGHGEMGGGEPKFGDAHIDCPASGTRVWADDIDGDGKLDLLIGDQLTLQHVAKGVEEETARTKLKAWQKKQNKLFESVQDDSGAADSFSKKYEQLMEEKKAFVIDEMTGFVWLMRQK